MGEHARLSRERETVLLLDQASITIRWQAAPTEDVLASLLLELIGEDELRRIYD